MEISGGIDICQMSFPTGATAILLLVCILSLLSTKCPAASILRSARFSSMQTTKKPHGYHKIAVWQKDDRIRKSPLKFYVYHYSEPSGDCQASIFLINPIRLNNKPYFPGLFFQLTAIIIVFSVRFFDSFHSFGEILQIIPA